MMSVLPNELLSWVFSTLDPDFVSFLPFWYRPRTQRQRIIIPNEELFPIRVPEEFSRIAFPVKVLPKDDRTGFAQEERLDLPYWTMILAICVLVDAAKYLDKLTSGSVRKMMHLPFWLGRMQILRQLLVLRILVVVTWYPWLLLPSFVKLMILVQ